MSEDVKIEICLDSVASAIAAESGGADRVELADNLLEGGTTPSDGMLRVVRERVAIGIQMMIRPRGGDFCYSEDEYAVMEADVRRAREQGADGVVFGILNPDGTVDTDRCARLRELAGPMNATFHRAFDVTPDPHVAFENLVEIGFDRVLTSGQAPTVWEGLDLIVELVDRAGDRIVVMPGGDLREDSVGKFRQKSGAREFHLRLDEERESAMSFRRDIPMGGVLRPPEFGIRTTDVNRVRFGRQAVSVDTERLSR